MTFESYPLAIEGTDVYDLERSVEREILRKKLNSVAAKSNAWIDPVVDFGMDTTAADNSTALQNAIDEAHSSDNLDVEVVRVPPGVYKFTGILDWKNCHIIAVFPNNSVRFIWDGAAGATFITKSSGVTFGEMAGINFRPGANVPSVWLDLTVGNVDKNFRLHDLQFMSASVAAIDIAGWINLQWDHLRWDMKTANSGWALRATPPSTQSLASAVIRSFTYDHIPPSSPSDGFIRIDNSADAPNLGVFKLDTGRIEVNTAWGNHQAIVSYRTPDSNANPRALGLHLSDVTYQDVVGMASDVVFFRDTADTSSNETLKLTNFRSGGLSQILGGTWPSNFPRPTGDHYLDLSLGRSGFESLVHRPGFALHPAATSLGSVTNRVEVFDESGASLGFLPVYDAIT